ncbi:MAG: 50S ribosomal protein L31 [Patescibacteria group bacterium]|mgnify:FL=1
MKKDTHPIYYTNALVTCSCGNTFNVGGTQEKIKVEICSVCHPFFTGDKKIIDTAGRVERFRTRSSKKSTTPKKVKAPKKKKVA